MCIFINFQKPYAPGRKEVDSKSTFWNRTELSTTINTECSDEVAALYREVVFPAKTLQEEQFRERTELKVRAAKRSERMKRTSLTFKKGPNLLKTPCFPAFLMKKLSIDHLMIFKYYVK